MYGFSYQQNGKGYWYAHKRYKGKLHQVYLGKDLEDATAKIKVYCGKHKIVLMPRRITRIEKLEKAVEKLTSLVNEDFDEDFTL